MSAIYEISGAFILLFSLDIKCVSSFTACVRNNTHYKFSTYLSNNMPLDITTADEDQMLE